MNLYPRVERWTLFPFFEIYFPDKYFFAYYCSILFTWFLSIHFISVKKLFKNVNGDIYLFVDKNKIITQHDEPLRNITLQGYFVSDSNRNIKPNLGENFHLRSSPLISLQIPWKQISVFEIITSLRLRCRRPQILT